MAHPVLWPKKTFFYPIGNTPPVCFTQDLAPELKADVLLLACGDPRSILYMVYADIATYNRPIDITCCDWEPAVLARNILLLTMVADGVPSSNMWCIFYHFFLDKTSYEVLLAQCRALIQLSSDMDTWKKSKYGRYLKFCMEHTLAEVRRHWVSYLETDSLTDAEKKGLMASFTSGMRKVRDLALTTMASVRSAGPLAPSFIKVGLTTHKDFWSTGVTPSKLTKNVPTPYVNPTFAYCQAGKVFNVHYGTDPLLYFHLAPALTSIKDVKSVTSPITRTLVELAMAQFASWCTAFNKRVSTDSPSNIIIRIFAGESLAFCHALRSCREGDLTKTGVYTLPWGGTQTEFDPDDYAPSSNHRAPLSFNVIDSSNLADHAGLLNLLVVTAPLLEKLPWSILHTNTLLPSNHVGSPKSGLPSKALADIPTLSMLLGIAPYPYFSHFTTHSNKHEIITSPIILGQLLEPISWRLPPSSIPSSAAQNIELDSTLLVCNAEKLGHFLFSVYIEMFSEEDVLGNLLDFSLEKVQKQFTIHYVRQSLVAFFRLVKDRVEVDWPQAMSTFLDLLESDRKLLLGLNNYQDLLCHLYLHSLFMPTTMEPSFVEGLRRSHPCFKGWKDIPSVVCVVLKVPRSALRQLEDIDADKIVIPILQCESRLPQGHSNYLSIQPMFGDISLTHGGGEAQVGISEDRRAWQGNSSLIVTFYMPTWIILSDEPSAISIGLNMRSSPSNVTLLLSVLGPALSIYSTNLSDEEHIWIVRHRPGNLEECSRLRKASTFTKPYNQPSTIAEKVVLNFDDSGMRVTSLTIRHDVTNSEAARALSGGANVTMKPQTDSSIMVSFDHSSKHFGYPFPIRSNMAKCRVARKSSYIEIEGPIRPSFEDFLDFSLNPFPVARHNDTVNILNIHYVDMDLLPALKLPMTQDKLFWLNPHLGCAFSENEKQVKERPNQEDCGVLVNIKESISAIFIDHAGLRGLKEERHIFGLSDPNNGGVYALIFVNGIKLDLASHTIVVDACVIPLYEAIMGKISPALQKLTNQGFHQVVTLDDEVKVWRLLLPALAERCRTWKHSSKCEYLLRGIPVALEGPTESPLCSCGKGRNLGPFGNLTEWRILHKEATRIAISPLFSFSFMEDMMAKMNKSINEATDDKMGAAFTTPSSTLCNNCGGSGKPKLLVCSRCKKAKYCSRSCQNTHWKAHKRLCVPS